MAEKYKSSTHSDLENDSSETKAEIPSISDQPAPISNTGQLEESPEDTKMANSPKDVDIDSLPKSSLLPPPTHQSEHSSTANPKTSVVESISPTSRNQSENKKLTLERDETSETKAETPVIPEKNPLTSAPSTSSDESPRKGKQSHEGLDQPLVDKVQKLELEAKTGSPGCMSKSQSKGINIKSKRNNDQTWKLPFRVRKTGLTSVWNEPDEDFVPNLAIRKGIRPSSIPQQYEETSQGTQELDIQCQRCHRPILENSLELLCQKCLEEVQRAASAPQEPEGACGGTTSDPHYFLVGATAAPFEEGFPRSYSDFKETYERRSSFEDYVRMRHRQREGLPPYDKPHQGTTNQQLDDVYGDYERSDSEEDYRRMHYLQQEFLGAWPPTQNDIFEEMRLAQFEIFAALNRPGETFEDLRNPEQEMFEVQHYDRQMAKLAARFGGAPLEETTFPWKPQEFLDQETLYELWRPPPDPVEKDEVEDMSPETRKTHELEKMALLRMPREHAEEVLGRKDESEESGSESEDEDTEYSEESLPSND